MGRISTGAKVGAALVACLAVPAVAVLVAALGDLRGDDAQATADVLDGLDAAAAVSECLEAESIWYGFELIGTAEAFELPPGVDAESPHRTDEAIEALRTVLEDQDAGTPAAYAPAFDALGTLGDIRADIEAGRATPDFGSFGSADLAFDVRTRYAEVGHAVREATARAVDDPDLRANIEVGAVTARQRALLGQMATSLIAAAVSDGLNTADEIAAVAGLQGEWLSGDAMLRAAGAPYDVLVDEHVPADFTAEVTTVVGDALATGTVDLPAVLDTVTGPGAQGLSDLEAAIAGRRDELARAAADADDDHERRALLVAAAAGLTALASVAVAVVILAVAASRRPGRAAPPGHVAPPQWPLP